MSYLRKTHPNAMPNEFQTYDRLIPTIYQNDANLTTNSSQRYAETISNYDRIIQTISQHNFNVTTEPFQQYAEIISKLRQSHPNQMPNNIPTI